MKKKISILITMLFFSAMMLAQEKSIVITVVDGAGSPIPGASVVVKETTKGWSTDFDGVVTIKTTSGSIVVISSLGYGAKEVVITNQTDIKVSLEQSSSQLDEIIVVGYGTQSKASLTGSVAVIKSEDIVKNSTSNISSALSGRLAGLVAVQSSGEPGRDQSSLRIRGLSTYNGSEPLVLVDGIQRSLNSVNSNDIENITVLKDAAAGSIYGMKAANGVILVTTKRGGSKKPVMSYNSYYGIQKNTRMPNFLDSYNYGVLLNEANKNDGTAAAYTAAELQMFKDGSDPDRYPNTDWIKETLGTGTIQSHDFSLRGGYEKVKYFTSLGYLEQEGVYSTTGYKKYNFRSNLDVEINDYINVSADFSGVYENFDRAGTGSSGIFSNLMRTSPTEVNRYSNGGYSEKSLYQEINSSGYNRSKNFTFQSKLALNIKVPGVDGLTLISQIAYDRIANRNKAHSTPFTYTEFNPTTGAFTDSTPSDRGDTASLTENSNQGYLRTLEQIIDYKKNLGDHKVGGKLIYSRTESRYDFLSAGRSNLIGNSVDYFVVGDEDTRTNSNSTSETAIAGYAGRLNYSYQDKYFIEFNGRYDKSHLFSYDLPGGFFPSVSGAWTISKEDFMQDFGKLDNLKLRASYGNLGSDNIGRFRDLSLYFFGGPIIDNGEITKTLYDNGIADPTSTWEKATTYNVGLDASFLNGMFTVEADVFYKRTTDILANRSLEVPGTFGATLPQQNLGIVENKGFEVVLGHSNTVNDWNYYANFNLGFARNKVIEVSESESVDEKIRSTGRSIGARVGYLASGLFFTQKEIDDLNAAAPGGEYQPQSPKPGDIRYADINGDGIVNDDDRTIIGRGTTPEITYGLNMGLTYKQFDFSVLLQGAANFDMYLSGEASWAFFNGGKVHEDHLGRAQIGADGNVINTNATYPRLSISSATINQRTSSYWVESGDYMRLKNVEIGYSLPKNVLNKVGIGSLRLYLNGRNLFTWSGIENLDPENPQSRGWFYPQQKVFNLGINVEL
ncbi:SusC/RagA family TonB-linked outer membrane protein [Polaribacter sp. IC073]|uniref:SusC/RagA family TonB-linked outer membrane protein n=1 Tax=Polaribacter sp. IC073 TaxID=2508540 RepID=UPI0011BEF1D3|nr:TonB-dependent receptor [Polaribacter sp. IC073]TXD47870.1 TonB-dependent receptor [Polaribacter sp. IC073]